MTKKKRNIYIIAIVLLMGVVALLVAVKGSKDSTFNQDYHIDNTDAVTKIFLADKNNQQVLLQRVPGAEGEGSWLVDGLYPASEAMVDMLLETLNTMRIRQQVNKNALANIVKDISSSSVKVEVYMHKYLIDWFGGAIQLFEREKLVTTYFVGRETQDQMSTYMYRSGDKVPCIICIPGFRGHLGPRFPTSPYVWRSHRIVALDVREIERVELDITEAPEQSFAIFRNSENFGFELTHSHTVVPVFDTARVAQLLISLNNLNFDEYAAVVPNAVMDSSFAHAPRSILRITDTNNVTHEVKTYIKYNNVEELKAIADPAMSGNFDLDRLYAIVDSKDTVLIQYYTFDNILQPASFFLGGNVGVSK